MIWIVSRRIFREHIRIKSGLHRRCWLVRNRHCVPVADVRQLLGTVWWRSTHHVCVRKGIVVLLSHLNLLHWIRVRL